MCTSSIYVYIKHHFSIKLSPSSYWEVDFVQFLENVTNRHSNSSLKNVFHIDFITLFGI